jgi:signal transduction histidine kinase/DNA-binding response OmpR family regulator
MRSQEFAIPNGGLLYGRESGLNLATILVVDDYVANRTLLARLLSDRHRVLEAGDGAEALALVRAEHPDLVITDILMPTMDGYEFVRQLRDDPAIADTTVIFYTANYRGPEVQNLAMACDVRYILNKPCEPELVMDTVEMALGSAAPLKTQTQDKMPAQSKTQSEKFSREHLRLVTDKLSETANNLALSNRRLAALFEMNLEFASERDLGKLLDRMCRAPRDLIGAKYALAAVGAKDEGKTATYFSTSGMNAVLTKNLQRPSLNEGVVGEVFAARKPRRLTNPGGYPGSVGLPSGHPPGHAFLVAPIVSNTHVYGWICLTDKVGAEEFSEEDERLLTIHAAQVGRLYENGTLYEELGGQAAKLEAEVTKRKFAEDEAHRLSAELERRVAERTAELEAANLELESFDYSISHDLRAPLRRLQGFSAMLLEQYADKLDEHGKEFLRKIDNAGQGMDQLIEDLLKLSIVTRGEMRRTEVGVSALAQAVFGALQRANPEREVECVVAPGLIVRADYGLLRVVLENLLGNAWKFTGKTRGARIEVGCTMHDRVGVLFVRDNGAGFDMAYADKLFSPFQRLHSAGEFEGTGIGLATVHRIIRRHGGRVWAESAINKGATFYFTLPS